MASSDDAIIGEDLDGIMTDWNRGAEVILGYTAEEAIGRPLSMLLPPGQEDEMARMLERIKAGERIEHFETRRRRKDGTIIDVSLTISPVWDDAGRLVGASKVARDITATKRAQAELEAREAHLRSVLDSIPDAMIVIDNQGIMRSFSATAERLFGYVTDEAVGNNVSMLMPSPYREQHDSYLARYFATGEKKVIGRGRVVVGQRKDGGTTGTPTSARTAAIISRSNPSRVPSASIELTTISPAPSSSPWRAHVDRSMPVPRRPPWVVTSKPDGVPASVRRASTDSTMHCEPNRSAASRSTSGRAIAAVLTDDLVRAGPQQPVDVVDRADAAADRQRDEHLFGGTAYHLIGRLAGAAGGGDVVGRSARPRPRRHSAAPAPPGPRRRVSSGS